MADATTTDRGFRLTVLTEEKAVIDENVHSIQAPGTEGYLGVLRNHAALVTALQAGKLSVTALAGSETTYAISGGFLEINRNTATVLCDSLEPTGEIDRERAERSAERARGRLDKKEAGVDTDRAGAALKRALNRIRLSRRHRD